MKPRQQRNRPTTRVTLLASHSLSWWTIAVCAVAMVPVGAARGDDVSERLDQYVTQGVADWEVPGLAIAVVKDDKVVFAKGYGVRELGKPEQVDTDTLFQIASTTKAMTAATVGMLVDEGKLGWDDPVAEHLPTFELNDPYATREMRIRDLLVHRGGLPNTDFLWYPVARPSDEVAGLLRHVKPGYSLRSSFVYQNVMYMMAGEVVESVSDQPWGEFTRERLLLPLEMERTSLGTVEAGERGNAAVDHRRVHGKIRPLENRYVDADKPLGPAGALWSSVNDMSRWIRLVLGEGELEGKRLLSEEVVAEMLRPQTIISKHPYPTYQLIDPHWSTYGLGWFQCDYQGRAISFHTGSFEGMAAIVGIIPDEELGVVVLSNLDHAELRHALMLTVFDYYGKGPSSRDWSTDLRQLYAELEKQEREKRDEQAAQRVADTTPSLPAERYVGTYTNRLQGDIEIAYREGELHVTWGPHYQAKLEHWHFDTYSFEWPEDERRVLVSFTLDAQGIPHRLSIDGHSTWRRVEPPAASAEPAVAQDSPAAGRTVAPAGEPASSPRPGLRGKIPEVLKIVRPLERNQ